MTFSELSQETRGERTGCESYASRVAVAEESISLLIIKDLGAPKSSFQDF